MRKKLFGKIGTIILACALILSNAQISVFANETEVKAPIVFENFDGDMNVTGTNDTTVSIEDNAAKLVLSSSGYPSSSYRSLLVTQDVSVDVSEYQYVTFEILDSGSNSALISLVDANGNISSGAWTGNTTAGEWSQLSVKLSNVSDVDLTQITGIYIGEWNAGTYYIDDIMFSDVCSSDLTVSADKASGTYQADFNVVLSANDENYTIYYTTDGTTPTIESDVYSEPITVDESMVINAIVIVNGNYGDVAQFVYTIDNTQHISYEPIMVQTFENSPEVSAADGAEISISDEDAYQGDYSLKYVKANSASPEIDNGSVLVQFNHSVNVEGLKYLAFYINDTQGSNTMRISLIDGDGNESDFGWRSPSTSQNQWIQYVVSTSAFSGIDLTDVVAIRIGQWNSGTYYIDSIYFTNYLSASTPDLKPLSPVADIDDGYRFTDSLTVTFSNDSCAPMYYTLDGSTPSIDSLKYTDSITMNDTTCINIVSYDNSEYSDVVTYQYIKDESVLSDVIASKTSGKYSKAIDVVLSHADNYDIYYTLDGSTPDNNSNLYTKSITIDSETTLKAIAYDDNGNSSNILTCVYTFPTIPTVVTSSLEEGIYSSSQSVELISDPDASIYYTLDGSDPTESSTLCTGLVTVSSTITIKAIAYRDGLTSEVSTFNYTIAPEKVVADKGAGTYTGSTVVELRVPDNDQVNIYYTTDGSEPTIESTYYTQPFQISEDTIIKAVATYYNSDSLSESATFEYIILPVEDAVAPVITPSSGTYGTRQTVEITTETDNGVIYYTTDGSTPTKDSSLYENSFVVKESTTIKAITVKDNDVSDVTISEITIDDTSTAFLKTDGTVMRNNYGAGEVVQLKGVNIGGWLVMEEWQCPTNSQDQKTTIEVLTERFGEEAAWELINTYQDNWFTEDDIALLKDEGVNVLRIPFTYFEMANDDGSLKETAFARLDWVIETAAKYEIYTLIDMHGAFGSQNGKDHSGDITYPDVGDFYGNEENIEKTIALWEAIAERYKGNEWVAGYDLLNEPSATGTEQFEVYDRIYDAIRAIDQDHIIHIQSIWEPMHLPDPDLYGWENIVYQYHFYGWDDINNYDYQKSFVDSKVTYVNEYTQYDVPLFVGEFTFFTNTDSWEYALSTFDEQGWSYTSWTYKVAGSGSSWGMYTMAKDSSTEVDIYNDDYDTIMEKWSHFDFTRNDSISDVLSKHFKSTTVDTTAPTIDGQDVTITVDQEYDLVDLLDLYVFDDHDGVIKVTDDMIQNNIDVTQEGEYTVIVTVSDAAGNEAISEFIVKVSMVDTTAPVINGEDVTMIVGDTTDVSELLNLSIIDDQDGVITEYIIDIGDYDCTKAGIYTIVITASDAAGNKASASFTITVTEAPDTTPPVINGEDATIVVGDTTDVSTLLNLSIIDDQDGQISVYQILTNNYDCTQVGEYTIDVIAVDSAGNKASASFTITVTVAETGDKDSSNEDHDSDTTIKTDVQETTDTSSSTVKTSDNNQIMPIAIICLGSLIMAGYLIIKKKKEY